MCVVAVPSSYHENQKHALQMAAELAGFDEIHLLDESVAAAKAYKLDY